MNATTILDITLPDVGEGIAEAEIIEWLAHEDEAVAEDQAIVLISTDKATVELPAPAAGVLRKQLVEPGTSVPVGSALAHLEVSAEAAAALQGGAAPAHSEAEPPRRPQAAPVTRRLAQQLGIDLSTITGSGPDGRILDIDVRRAADLQRAPHAPDEERMPLHSVRRAIAQSTTASWQAIPHIVEFRQIDAAELVRARDALRPRATRGGTHLTFLPFFVRAVVRSLEQHARFNACLDIERSEVIYRRTYDIGIATATEEGLIVPVLRDAGRLSLFETADAIRALSERARNRTLSADDLAGGTFTITNFGSYGTWLGTPIIRSPEVGIAGFGRIGDAVVPVDGAAAVRPVLSVSVATDHRLNDGLHLAEFLDTLSELLADPILLLADASRQERSTD
ncbi:2-oxo acid dehydrogenase subunit E2 [bacterium]|nr:MAG: 2-oxo acid dehydrogenase subunit E2 [bacterium]